MKILKISLLLSLFVLGMTGCKQRFYNMPSRGMEATLPMESKALVTETDQFAHNNIVVFNYFGDDYSKPQLPDGQFEKKWQKYISRLIAMSGDSLQVKAGDIFINGKEVPHAPGALLRYEIHSGLAIDDLPERGADSFEQEAGAEEVIYRIPLTREEARDYSMRKPAIKSVRRILMNNSLPDSFYAKECGNTPVNADNIGPLYIPRPGDTITVSDCNRKLYANIPGIQPGKNVIKEKLYFMISDNWYEAMDSRYIGFISESKLFGIVKE